MDYTYTPDAAAAAANAAAATGFWAVLAGIWVVILIAGLVGLVFWIWSLVDVSKRQFTNPGDKTLWLVLLIVSFFFGLHLLMAIIYLIVGRKKGTLPGN